MMTSLGNEVYLYAGEENESAVTELITCVSKEEQAAWWPGWDPQKSSWPDGWNTAAPWWGTMNSRAIWEIQQRIEPGDTICLIGGCCQQSIAQQFPEHRSVEFGVGYKGVFSDFKVFESYAWMSHVYGRLQMDNGIFFDAVIPNYFDPLDFPFYRRAKCDEYLLYIGRIVESKGIEIVKEVVKHTGIPLKVAGQGNLSLFGGIDIDYQGVVEPQVRNLLMADAKAVLVPTLYIEPFGGVAVEAQLSGTPVITTDWGAFPETVVDGVTGRRCRVLREFIDAVDECEEMDRREIRRRAERYLTTNVRYEYQRYFERLALLDRKGWYELSASAPA